jgi:hypothetical protein
MTPEEVAASYDESEEDPDGNYDLKLDPDEMESPTGLE